MREKIMLPYVLILLLLFCFAAGSSIAQSKSVDAIIEEHDAAVSEFNRARRDAWRNPENGVNVDSIPYPEIFRRFWFYPSTIRALNLTNDSLWNALSLGMVQLVVLSGEQMSLDTREEVYKRLAKNLSEEGFETWMAMSGRRKGVLFVIEEEGVVEHFVLLSEVGENMLVIDFEGTLTPQQMMEIRNMDLDKLLENFAGSGIISLIQP